MKPAFLFAMALLLLPLLGDALAQAAGNSIFNNTTSFNSSQQRGGFLGDSTIVLEVRALKNVQADSYIAILGVAQVGETIESANTLINSRIDSFVTAVSRLGIARTNVYVDLVSQVPTYEFEVESKRFSRTYNEVPSGFDLKKNVHITYTRNEQLDQILLAASRYEIYDIVKVDYVVDDIERIYDTLRSASIALMARKVSDYERLGVKLVSIYQTIEEDIGSVYPIERYSSYVAYNSTSLPSTRRPKGATTVTVNTAPKPATIYYNRMSYNGYDIVIEPGTLEPKVQFSYRLAMKYLLKKS